MKSLNIYLFHNLRLYQSNEEFPKRGAVSRRRQLLSDASSDGGGRTPVLDTTSPALREASSVPAGGTVSNGH